MIEGAWLVEGHMHGGWSMAINDEHSDSLITTKLHVPLSPPAPLAVFTLNSCAISWVYILTIILAPSIWWSLLQSFSIKQFSWATHGDRLCTFTASNASKYQWWEHHHLCSFKQSQHSEWVLMVSHLRCPRNGEHTQWVRWKCVIHKGFSSPADGTLIRAVRWP